MKLKWDPKLRSFIFHRALPLATLYPYDWGFVPGARTRRELERFFLAVVDLTGKEVRIHGWKGPKFANRLIDRTALEP